MTSAASVLGRGLQRNLIAGTRLALFLPVRALDFRVGPGHYVLLIAASLAFWLAGGIAREGFSGSFNAQALFVTLAQIPLVLLACLVAARIFRNPALLLAFAVVFTSTDPLFEVAAIVVYHAVRTQGLERYGAIVNWLFIGWALASILRTQWVLTGWRAPRSYAAAALFAVMLGTFVWVLPRSEPWSGIESRPEQPSVVREDLFHLQGVLLEQRLSELEPERPGIEDLYFVGVAAYGLQDTFAKELRVVKQLMDTRFDTAGRSIALVNHPATLAQAPLATATNLNSALEFLGNNINVEEDLVMLFISTHGAPEQELSFQLPPLELNQVNPTVLARMLADSGIKWKVIVLSACYSGGFIEALKDENTLIITAADAKHSSFGCEYSSDITWFGQAYFQEGLRSTYSLEEAFDMAKRSIARRELAEGLEPSNPQIFVGGAIREKLEAIRKRLESSAGDATIQARLKR